jgi:cell fate regulator YaaT (PSP1 superfamily)
VVFIQVVVGVRFKKAGKIYYFDPNDIDITQGEHVIVETARGVEYGEVVVAPKEVSQEDIVSPLKKVIRKATQDKNGEYQGDRLLSSLHRFYLCFLLTVYFLLYYKKLF